MMIGVKDGGFMHIYYFYCLLLPFLTFFASFIGSCKVILFRTPSHISFFPRLQLALALLSNIDYMNSLNWNKALIIECLPKFGQE